MHMIRWTNNKGDSQQGDPVASFTDKGIEYYVIPVAPKTYNKEPPYRVILKTDTVDVLAI